MIKLYINDSNIKTCKNDYLKKKKILIYWKYWIFLRNSKNPKKVAYSILVEEINIFLYLITIFC